MNTTTRLAAYSAFVFGCALLPSTTQGGLMITNGSFESEAQSASGLYSPSLILDWTGGYYLVRGDIGWGVIAQDGAQFVDIGNRYSPALSTDFTVPVTTTYTLSWHVTTGAGISSGVEYDFQIDKGGTFYMGETLFSAYSGAWHREERTVTLEAGTSYSLTFSTASHDNAGDTLIDNVSLVIPEPHDCGFLAGLGLTAFAACRRSKKP